MSDSNHSQYVSSVYFGSKYLCYTYLDEYMGDNSHFHSNQCTSIEVISQCFYIWLLCELGCYQNVFMAYVAWTCVHSTNLQMCVGKRCFYGKKQIFESTTMWSQFNQNTTELFLTYYLTWKILYIWIHRWTDSSIILRLYYPCQF